MSALTLSVRDANPDDITAIMAIENLPDYAERVGALDHDEHAEKLADPHYRYRICMVDDKVVGFVVFKDVGHEMGNLCLHRIAVGDAGRGVGTGFIRALCDWVFSDTDIFRLWLDVLPSNAAARHVYAKIGFREEGLMRSALRYPDGRRADLILMSLLRPDWLNAQESRP